ncbi:hypothetical protein [Flavihumibacter profundi]|jgi:hypothetical protein|uniref:hypothetical protein n=1 Tax=Flavihumibacter profundi TaxID=2716883 RepID=UPI001CC3D16D|nr:hypothetical protein [Flavihumibacter profundi]MBZ5855578.1 hypothetical protein [Flavihumibacter profundi]
MKKKLAVFLVVSLFLGHAHAQTFMHGVGTGFLVNSMQKAQTSAFGTLMYSPRVTVMESESSSLTVGIPLSFGVSGSYNYDNYYGTSNSLQYMINAPVMLNINWGAGSSKESSDRFGYFLGGGFGLNHGSYVIDETIANDGNPYEQTVEKSLTTYGPAANGGVRFGVGQGTHNIEILLSYMKGLNENKPNTFGVHGIFNF